ncbi:MAG: UxaA family hydrolase [Deltaproteobacteria bacterium]|nr:UxaA family hydrolase [Deltaproteobacteria bacterium]
MDKVGAIIMDETDNVATLLSDVKKQDKFQVAIHDRCHVMQAEESIPFGHKIALTDIGKGEKIVKYGEVIGEAVTNIKKGTHVHVHNVKSLRTL